MTKVSPRGIRQTAARYIMSLSLILTITVVGLFWFGKRSEASSPSSGSLNPTVGTSVTPWNGDRITPATAANGEPSCTTGDASAANCDVYTLTANPGNWAGKRIKVRFNWTLPANDYDMTVRQETNGTPQMQGDGVVNTPPLDTVAGTSGNGTNTFEEVVLSPPDAGATYYVRAIYFLVAPGDQYVGTATVENTVIAAPPDNGTPATFDNYQPPFGYPRRDSAGEPSIGINWNTGNVMSMSRLQANRTTFNDSTSPADPLSGTTWFPKPITLAPTGFDPIGFTDPITGRSIFGELEVVLGATNAVLSDDDLTTVSNVVQTGGPTQGVDHQTIGGGPSSPNAPPGRQPVGGYPHMWYYASQSVATATVATSINGGYSYLPAVPAYTLLQCNGLHGHIKVAPNDGTVYLPNKGCGGKSGFAVSEDNGLTWTVRTVPTSTSGNTDPSVGIGAGGRVYFAYMGGDNRPHVAISNDKGVTWTNDFDLSQSVTPNLTAAVFPHAVAGDNNRAAVFFLATSSTNPGDPVGSDNEGAGPNFAGTWYPYIATTYDGGQSWTVIRADNDPLLPMGTKNPVQQGVICTEGTLCPAGPPDTRNLLDFNELAVDSRGRIVAVYADGCHTVGNPAALHPCMTQPDNDPALTTRMQNQAIARLTLIRQRDGRRLFGAFDPGGPSAPPLSPPVFIEENSRGFSLRWATPANGNSPLTAYRVYRGTGGGREQLVAVVSAKQNNRYFDLRTLINGGGSMYYKVTAVNAYGESPRNVKFFPSQSAVTQSKAE
jgi:hypothetical protein